MDHVIVVAHPRRDSFTVALAAACADELERLGHRPQLRDLYALKFNPVLTAQELGDFPGPGAHRSARIARTARSLVTIRTGAGLEGRGAGVANRRDHGGVLLG